MDVAKLSITRRVIPAQIGALTCRQTVPAVLLVFVQPPSIAPNVRVLPRDVRIVAIQIVIEATREEGRRAGHCEHSSGQQVPSHSVFHRRTPFNWMNTNRVEPFPWMNGINRTFSRA